MQDKTLEQIRLLFLEIATKHKQINGFFFGDFNRATSEKTLKYPLLLVDTVSANITKNGVAFTFQITIADSVLKGYENLNETFDDTIIVLKDVLDTMRSPKWKAFSSLQDSAQAERFYQKGADEVGGWYCRPVLTIHSPKDLCSIPFSDYDFDGTFVSNCSPVDIFENGILVDSVASGGSYSYSTACADGSAVAKDSALNVLSTTAIPSGSSIDIPVSDTTIKSSGILFTDSELAEGTYTIADVSWTDSDGSPQTTEYSAAITCTPATAPEGILYKRPQFRGQATTYRTGDVGWLFSQGYFDWSSDPTNPATIAALDLANLDPFNTLVNNNLFGNTLRFTSITGTAYTTGIAMDHLTGIMFTDDELSNDVWDNLIDQALASSIGGYTDWHLVSRTELNMSSSFEDNFPIASGNIVTSTTRSTDSARIYGVNINTPLDVYTGITKVTSRGGIYARAFNWNDTF